MSKRNKHAIKHTIQGFGLPLYTDEQLYSIHCATLEVLWQVGVRVDSPEAREVFAGAGAVVDEKTNIVHIPNYMVEDAIKTAPKTITLAGRDPAYDYVIEDNRVGFVNLAKGLPMRTPRQRYTVPRQNRTWPILRK